MARIKNINGFRKAKEEKQAISVVTCYDYAFARIIEETDIDAILVGDSLGNVVAGYGTTLPVTVNQMIYHSEIVRRGAPNVFIICDLPFMSYHVSIADTLQNCGRIMKRTGVNAVKLEGGRDFAKTVEALVRASIPVMGHLGFTPQSVHRIGGAFVQGREADARKAMIEDAKALQDAGAFSLVLEMVPEPLAREITETLSIPTIGIGAGRYCDGQVLVINDLLGIDDKFNPKFLKKYANLHRTVKRALKQYDTEVKERSFPDEEHSFQ